MSREPASINRRRLVAGMAGSLALPAVLLSRPAQAKFSIIDPLIWSVTKGRQMERGRVRLELPQLADNGNSVAVKVSVASPMTEADHVKAIHLISEKNPVREMASFYIGPRAGRAEIVSRVRLAGSQEVLAIAALSDGSFWYDIAEIVVTLSACLDEP